MNYLRKKLQAIMACADFKGYLREVTGYPLTLTDCMGSDLVSLSVTGNAVQNGTPSPETPVEVQGVGERTRNLFDVSRYDNVDGNSITATNTSGNVWVGRFINIDYAIEFGKTYTLVCDYIVENAADTSTIRFGYTSSSGTIGAFSNGLKTVHGSGSIVFDVTVPESIDGYNNFSLYINSSTNITPTIGDKMTISNVMILEGSYTSETVPTYEPYGYKVPVKVGGINLFDVSQITGTSGGYVQEGEIYVIGYPYQTGFTPKEFLAMTGLKEGDTFTTAADYEQVFQPPNPTSSGAKWITFAKKPSAPADLSNVQFGLKGALKTTTIPEGFNSDNYNGMYIYGGSGTTETGQVRAIYRNLRVYKGTYTADTMPPFEPYRVPQAVSVYADKPLYAVGDAGDTITLDFDAKTATRTDKTAEIKAYNNEPISGEYISSTGSLTEGAQVIYALSEPVTVDITDLQNWDAMPKMWRGTVVISANAAVQPSSMTAQYYATKKEED